jgi:rhodanese-related sulfurtransferase
LSRAGIDELLAEARRSLDRREPEAAFAAVASGALLVDTRTDRDRAAEGVISGALHLPLSVLEWRVDPTISTYNPHVGGLDRELIVVCNDGYSSSLAAVRLQRVGFARAADLVGGFRAWKAAGLPVVDAPPPADGLPGMGGPDPGSVPDDSSNALVVDSRIFGTASSVTRVS